MSFFEISNNKHFYLKKSFFAVMALLMAVLSSGCATTQIGESGKNGVEAMLKAADSELVAGQHEKAIAVLNQATKEHPTSPEPWMKLANIWFEKGNYPSSILAANEVLQRDAANQEAKSLLVVGGLRVAAAAVTGLTPTGSVTTGTRIEAENLTNSLRTALGEKVLVPPAEPKPVSYSRSKAKPRTSTPPSPSPAARQGNANAVATDPFKSLK